MAIDLSRRGFLLRAAAFVVAAPAIVHVGNLMPIRAARNSPQDELNRRLSLLLQYRLEITREYIRQNLFVPYTADELASMQRVLLAA
jgi:hypothetical protein